MAALEEKYHQVISSIREKDYGSHHGQIKISWKLSLDYVYTSIMWILDIMTKKNIQLQ